MLFVETRQSGVVVTSGFTIRAGEGKKSVERDGWNLYVPVWTVGGRNERN